MIIRKFFAQNYRTLENVELIFNGYYTAISGKNNAGKSNIIRAVRGILNQGVRFRIRGGSIFSIDAFEWNDEVTSWKKETKADISINITLEINKNADAAIYKFLTNLIFKDVETKASESETELLQINYTKCYNNTSEYCIFLGDNEVKDDYDSAILICNNYNDNVYNLEISPIKDMPQKFLSSLKIAFSQFFVSLPMINDNNEKRFIR